MVIRNGDTYNKFAEGILGVDCTRLDEALADSRQILVDEFGVDFWLHGIEGSLREKSNRFFVLNRDTVEFMGNLALQHRTFCHTQHQPLSPTYGRSIYGLGTAFLKYGWNRLLGSYGCLAIGFSFFGRVSLAGILAVSKSNFCLDLDLKPGISCSEKTKVFLTLCSVTSSSYSLGIV